MEQIRFETVDVCFNTLAMQDEGFAGLDSNIQAEQLSSAFGKSFTEDDVVAYKYQLMQYAYLERQLIAEQYYGNYVQHSEAVRFGFNP